MPDSDVVWLHSEEDYLDYLNHLANTGETAFVLFTAPVWCAPCQRFEPHYARASVESDALFLAVDIDDNEWVMGYDIRSVPTCVLVKGDRQERITVPVSAINLLKHLED